MRIEAPILDREERGDHVRRHAVERNVGALLDEEGEDLPVLPVEDDGALRVRADLGECGGVAELTVDQPRRSNRDRGDGPDQNRGQQHARDQKSSSHAAMNRNASATKTACRISGLQPLSSSRGPTLSKLDCWARGK